jgi:hypothetical protein
MGITILQTEKILKSEQPFSVFAFSMMTTLMKKRYAKDPTQATLQGCNTELNAFINKYESILGNDLAIIARL